MFGDQAKRVFRSSSTSRFGSFWPNDHGPTAPTIEFCLGCGAARRCDGHRDSKYVVHAYEILRGNCDEGSFR